MRVTGICRKQSATMWFPAVLSSVHQHYYIMIIRKKQIIRYFRENHPKVALQITTASPEERIVFVFKPQFRLAGRSGLHLTKLLGESFFLTEKNANYRRALDTRLAAQRLSLNPLLESSDTAFIIRILEQNDGLSFLPYFAVQQHIQSGRLCMLDVVDVDIAKY